MSKDAFRRPLSLVIAIASLAACGHQPAPSAAPGAPQPARQEVTSIDDGESLIRAMYQRYHDKWYHTMTFVQTTTIMRPGGPPQSQTWYEALMLPGRLRIDFGNPSLGNGALFRNDSSYELSGGVVTRADTGFNPLLILGFDVYTQPPEETISLLRHLGYQLSRLHIGTFDGKSTYIVGAATRFDSTSRQFWVERDRLLFVRTRERTANGQQSDITFTDYAPAGNGWVARQVWQYRGGEARLHEEYSGIRADVALDSALFDPRQWSTVKHWSK